MYSNDKSGVDPKQKHNTDVELLVQILFLIAVVLESFCYRTRANRLINESNTAGRLRKIWTGLWNLFQDFCVFGCPLSQWSGILVGCLFTLPHVGKEIIYQEHAYSDSSSDLS